MVSESHKLREADGRQWDKYSYKIRDNHCRILDGTHPDPLNMGEPKGTMGAQLLRIHQLQHELVNDASATDSSMSPRSNLMEDLKYSKVRRLLDRGYYGHYEAELREIRDELRAEALADKPRQKAAKFTNRCRDVTEDFLGLDYEERQDALSDPRYAVCVEVLADAMRREAQGEIFDVDELFPEPEEYERVKPTSSAEDKSKEEMWTSDSDCDSD